MDKASSDQTTLVTPAVQVNHPQDTLDELLNSSIREVLGYVIGQQARDAICSHLVENCVFKQENICKHLPKLLELLDEMFGIIGGNISRSIARDLFDKLSLEFPADTRFNLFDYIEMARTHLSTSTS